ncbi:MAG: hypothetical protein M1383_00735 [Patescibacteria group bacterium]|nr:hypothetical protein [Patescibacteria group bacterium]
MKKILLFAAAVIVLAGLAVIVLNYAGKISKDSAAQAEKTTAGQVAEAFAKKYNRPASSVNLEVKADTGTFAKGLVSFAGEMGGGVWFAAKTSSGWELVFDGNGIIPCDAANKYNLPIDMAPQCIDTGNNNNLVQR